VKTVKNEASLNPQMTQIGADEKTQLLTWVTEVPDSVINFDVSGPSRQRLIFNLRPSEKSADCWI
jgi:hypothetical protein